MNFSGKGNTGLFSSGDTPQRVRYVHQNNLTVEDVTRVDPDDGQRYGVHYWFTYAQNLSKGVQGLIQNKEEAVRIALERKAINAGLRGVVRELLKELRLKDPKHPLLEKKNRDYLFAQYEQEEMGKILKANNNARPWIPRERPDENQTE